MRLRHPLCCDSFRQETGSFPVYRSLFDYTGLFWHACPVCSDSYQRENNRFFLDVGLFLTTQVSFDIFVARVRYAVARVYGKMSVFRVMISFWQHRSFLTYVWRVLRVIQNTLCMRLVLCVCLCVCVRLCVCVCVCTYVCVCVCPHSPVCVSSLWCGFDS